METKPLLYGLIGFFAGGLLVAVAATTFNKPEQATTRQAGTSMSSMSMDDMTAELQGKTGDAFDKAFLAAMIAHHQGAVEMAQQAMQNAKHQEVKGLSSDIIAAQQKEIAAMRQWQTDWGYTSTMMDHSPMSH